MGEKRGITRDDVISVAAELADKKGLDGLQIADVAAKLKVKTPSLYHHVDGASGLRRALAMHGAGILRDLFRASLRNKSGLEALIAAGKTYRRFARLHPGLIEAMLPAPKPGDDDELYQALAAPVMELARVLDEIGVTGERAIHVIRVLRSYLHGFVDLERRGGFGMPVKLEQSFDLGLEMLISAVIPSKA
jgi:AcrR family transcriptional regulator